jgi:metallo-beta-lactamase class B
MKHWLSIPLRVLAVLAASLAPTVAPAQINPNPLWLQNHEPFRIADNLYYVGGEDLAVFLITTPRGLILINSNLESSIPQIRGNVEKLGFHWKDIKILLISHAHIDHTAGSAEIVRETGAKFEVMDSDVPVIESGGKADFHYGNLHIWCYPPVKVDRVLHDGDAVSLGGVTLHAVKTPGHTKGTTTWTMQVKDRAKLLNVVIVGSPNVNDGYHPANDPSYPNQAADYRHTFAVLEGLPCDLFLGAHGAYFGMAAKLTRLAPDAANPFIDPAGYHAYVAERKAKFEQQLAADVPPSATR